MLRASTIVSAFSISPCSVNYRLIPSNIFLPS
jgi:hypothetical protein